MIDLGEMGRKLIVGSLLASLSLLGNAQTAGGKAPSPVPKQFVGAWINVFEKTTKADGTPYQAFGGNTKGIAMFDESGHFSIIEIGDARKKFAKGRLEGSREENDGMALGSSSFYGTFSVDENAGTLTFHVIGSAYANIDGADLVRHYSFNGDELRWKSQQTTSGGSGEVAWKRAR